MLHNEFIVNLQVEYFNSDELLCDAQQQFSKGGLLVRVTSGEMPELYSSAKLALRSPQGSADLPAQVVQVVPGLGVALAFDSTNPDLTQLLETAKRAGFVGGPAKHSEVGPDHQNTEGTVGGSNSHGQDRAAMIQLARYGKKDDRMRIMRGSDRALHRFVLQNSGLGADEIVTIAKSSSVGPETLSFIAGRREWAARNEVAIALVRNTKCPIPIAVSLLAHVAPTELRQIAKTASVRMPIVSAARKRVLLLR